MHSIAQLWLCHAAAPRALITGTSLQPDPKLPRAAENHNTPLLGFSPPATAHSISGHGLSCVSPPPVAPFGKVRVPVPLGADTQLVSAKLLFPERSDRAQTPLLATKAKCGALRAALGPPTLKGHGRVGERPEQVMKMLRGPEQLCCGAG